jgi:hypothetical protein
MREDDERIIEQIKDIVYKVVGIEQCGYGWGGDEYGLTNVDKAAEKIFDLMMKNRTSKLVK